MLDLTINMYDHKRNWKLYNQVLVNRGNFTLYISEESLQKAEEILHSNNKKKRVTRINIHNVFKIPNAKFVF